MKKWVTDKVKEVADRGVAGWRIKAEALAAAGMEVPEAAAAPAQPVAPEGSLRDVVEGSPKKAAAGGMLKFVGKVKRATYEEQQALCATLPIR